MTPTLHCYQLMRLDLADAGDKALNNAPTCLNHMMRALSMPSNVSSRWRFSFAAWCWAARAMMFSLSSSILVIVERPIAIFNTREKCTLSCS